MGERVFDRLREMKKEKIKWLIVLALLMMVGMFCMAFDIVAVRVGFGLGEMAFTAILVIDIAVIIRIARKKFGDLEL
jgi:hypothetical protein